MNHSAWRRGAPGLVILLGASAAWAQGRAVRKPLQVVGGAGASTIVGAPPTANIGAIPSVNTVPAAGGVVVPPPTVTVTAPTITPPAGTVPNTVSGPMVGGGPVGSARPRESQVDIQLTPIQPVPGGLTADQMGQRARTVNYDVAAKNEAVRAAAAKVDQAFVNFFPRLAGTARYTRLSSITPPVLGAPGVFGVSAVGANIQPGGEIPAGAQLIATPPFAFPVILNNYSLQASISIPISDYFLRISQNYSAATHSEEAARLDKLAAEAKAVTDAKLTYYNWVKAVGQREVLAQALEAAREHAKDAEALFKSGQASKADLLQAQAQVAQGQLSVAQADEFLALTLEQLRLAIQAKPDEKITIGENVLEPLPKTATDGTSLRNDAVSNRAELRSLVASEMALTKVASINRASAWPQVAAVGNYYYQNPNSRIFPQQEVWKGTWDINLQATWALNDVFTATASGREGDANVSKLRAQRMQVRDGIMLEVTQAITAAQTADAGVESSSLNLASAEEAYRVRKELYRVGRATGVELTDAEANLVRTKLTAVSARIDQRVARVRLEHASGRDLARLSGR